MRKEKGHNRYLKWSRTCFFACRAIHATRGTFDHWLVWNIPPAESIKENNNAGTAGKNSSGKIGYYPPCPPSGSHRYYFHVYAVDVEIDLKAGADKPSLKKAIEAHIIAEGTIMGRYKKANGWTPIYSEPLLSSLAPWPWNRPAPKMHWPLRPSHSC